MDHLSEDGHLGGHLSDGLAEFLILHLDSTKLGGQEGILFSNDLLFLLQSFDLLSFSFSR